MINSHTLNLSKLGVVGLDNAGKTSLIKTLFRSFDITQNIAPTKGVDRTGFKIWGIKGGIWDFGGQEIYRKNYLDNPERYFSEITFLFYVIDIQDIVRYGESLEYFSRVYALANQYSPELDLIILFHKFDPELDDQKYNQHIENIKREIRKIAENQDMLFFKTSIYDPISILEAFSKPLLGASKIYNQNSLLFANFSVEHNIEYMTVLMENLFEFGSFRINSPNLSFIRATSNFFQQYAAIDDKDRMEYELEGYKFVIIKDKYKGKDYSLNYAYNIETCTNPPTEEDIKDLMEKIKKNLMNSDIRFF